MAKFWIDATGKYYESLYLMKGHESTSWEASKSQEFQVLIDKVEKSKEHKLSWTTPLPKLEEDKKSKDDLYYHDLEELWVRCKIHVENTESEWIILGPLDQRVENVILTKGEDVVEKTDSIKLEWLQ